MELSANVALSVYTCICRDLSLLASCASLGKQGRNNENSALVVDHDWNLRLSAEISAALAAETHVKGPGMVKHVVHLDCWKLH